MYRKNSINYLIIFGISLIYFIVLIDKDTFYNAHDLTFHTSNIISMAKSISITNLLPSKILPVLVNNLGYGVNIFYPSLPHLIGAYLYKIFSDIKITILILNLLIINLSGITIYKLVDKIFKNKEQALLTSITYISMPYLFADIFIRSAINESFLLFIIPLILLGIHYLIDDNNKLMFHILFVLGYVLAINSHLVLSIYLTIILIIYLLVKRKKVFKKEIIINFIIASIFILLLTLNFTLPLIEHYKLGIYNIFNIEYTNTESVHTVSILKYLLPIRYIDIPLYIPPLITIVLIFLLVKRKEINKNYKNTLLGMSIILIVSIFLATNSFIWTLIPNILRNIQFGWRMTLFVAITTSILFGYTINLLKKDLRKIFLINFIIIFAITNFISSLMTVRVEKSSLKYLDDISNIKWAKEYLPLDASNNILNIEYKEEDLGVNEKKANIKITKNNVPNMEFTVKNLKEEVVLEFPRIYYLGYKLTDKSGKEYKLSINSKGLLQTKINKNTKYKLEYIGTNLGNIANIITIISLITFILYLFMLKFNKENKRSEQK